MVQLSLLDEVKDRASRLIPTPYMESVEECTAPGLLIPTFETVRLLCETVSRQPDEIAGVVRALRRRIADNDIAVKHLTVQLLDSMIKNSGTAFHTEVASQKGFLRDLVSIACIQPTTGRAMQAKEAALLLTLNLSIWFHGHPVPECYILTTLADDVRNQLGPNCFEGIEPDRNMRLRMPATVPAAAALRVDPRGAKVRRDSGGRAPSHRKEKRNIVDAIPIDFPTSERISAMLDVCMTFSEYLNNAEMNTDKPLTRDEVVLGCLSQVREDHRYVVMLLSSNLQLDRDLLGTVSDSQLAVLNKVEELSENVAGHAAAPQETQPFTLPTSAAQHTPVRSAVDTESPQHHAPLSLGAAAAAATPPRTTPPHAEVAAGGSGEACASASPQRIPAPSVDDLFGDSAKAASFSSSNALEASPVAQSSNPTEKRSADRSAPITSPSLNPSVPSPSQAASAVAPVATAEAAPAPQADPAVVGREDAEKHVDGDELPEKEQGQQKTEESAPAVSEAQTVVPEPTSMPAPAAAAPPKDDDDFDAFLEGRMSS
ncbi:hypothetical protein ABL78_5919 [Leptomonas seymouri]|uniref:VHS domain-containing protein n=1 Tax=Leptomonas seymouri TaxID=5684 RepID=A0A0N1PB53_LEPSE|nr:hypothetical protein ABL78_5919 [Leptomonas seymouri]|eukprot:KPI85035.1 hypothetical protein ABL78_5919 [Leptomonas seymouri]